MAYADARGKKEPEVPNPIAPPAVDNRPDDRVNPTVDPDANIEAGTPGYEIPDDVITPEDLQEEEEEPAPAPIAPPEPEPEPEPEPQYTVPKEQRLELDQANVWEPHYTFDEETGEATVEEANPVQPSSGWTQEQIDAANNARKRQNNNPAPAPVETVPAPVEAEPKTNPINYGTQTEFVAGQDADVTVGKKANTGTAQNDDDWNLYVPQFITKGGYDPYGAFRGYRNNNGTPLSAVQANTTMSDAYDTVAESTYNSRPDVPVLGYTPIGSSSGAGTYPVSTGETASPEEMAETLDQLGITPKETNNLGADDYLLSGVANVWNDIAGEDAFVNDVMANMTFDTPEEREAFEERVREIYSDELMNGMNPYYGAEVKPEDVEARQEEFRNERSEQIAETADFVRNGIDQLMPKAWETPVYITDELKTAARDELVDYASEYPEIAQKLKEPYYADNAVNAYLELIANGTPKDLAWEQVLSGDVTRSSLSDNLFSEDANREGRRQAEADTAARNAGLTPDDPAYYTFVDNYLGDNVDPRYGLKEPLLSPNYTEPEPTVEPELVDTSPFAMTDAEAARHNQNYTNPFAGYEGNQADLYSPINTTGGHWNYTDAAEGYYSDADTLPGVNEDGTMNDAMKELMFARVDDEGNDLYVEFDQSGNPHYYRNEQLPNGSWDYVPYYGKSDLKYDPLSILTLYVNPSYNGENNLYRGMDWVNDLSPEEQAGVNEILATIYRRGDEYFGINRPSGDRSDRPYEIADMTPDEYEKYAELIVKNTPGLEYLLRHGYFGKVELNEDGSLKGGEGVLNLMNFFFKDLPEGKKPQGNGNKKNGGNGYGYRSYGGGGRGGGGGGGYYRGGGGGSSYMPSYTNPYSPRSSSGGGYTRGGGISSSSGGTEISRSAEPTQTNQRQNRVYNIMKNWSF